MFCPLLIWPSFPFGGSLTDCTQPVLETSYFQWLPLWRSKFSFHHFNFGSYCWVNFILIWEEFVSLTDLDLLQIDDLYPSCLLRTNCSKIPQVLISPVELHFPSMYPLFLNLFVTFPFTELEFGRKEFWNPAQRTKYSNLEVIFRNFLNKILVLLPMEPVSLWNGNGFWPKDVLLTCLHPEVVECWGKVILLLLPCCLCVCAIVLTKNACGARSPPPLSYDDARGVPRKGSLFLLNAVGVGLVSSRRISWYFCLLLRLVRQSFLKFCTNNFLWLSEKMLAFSFKFF